jgi:uncharacterized protein YjeT (DUF2065 family)
MATILLAIGLVLVVEGLVWAAAPGVMRRLAEELGRVDNQTLRVIGVVVLALGTGLVFLARQF